ncbi:hypothetical protein BH23GEM7_BH23GEM7_08480 [soil metagenome]
MPIEIPPKEINAKYLRIEVQPVRLQDNFSLTGVEARLSCLSSTRKIVEVVCAFTNCDTDFTEKDAVSVDVTEGFPLLVKKLSPSYDRSA